MTTWNGWVIQFFDTAHVLNTPPNQRFMNEWAKHASSPSCNNNPIDLHRKVGASTNCQKPAGFTNWTQNYKTHANAATAFSEQINAPANGAISDSLGTGNPFQDPGYAHVVAALRQWPSVEFADWYLAQMQPASGSGGGSGTGIHKGWADLQHSLGKHGLKPKIDATNSLDAATLRALRRARKVRLR